MCGEGADECEYRIPKAIIEMYACLGNKCNSAGNMRFQKNPECIDRSGERQGQHWLKQKFAENCL